MATTETTTTTTPAQVDPALKAVRRDKRNKIADAITAAASNVPSKQADPGVVGFNKPKGLDKMSEAKLIESAKSYYVQSIGYLATAACYFAELNKRVLAAKEKSAAAPTWQEYCAVNFGTLSKARLTELVWIGNQDNPAQALVDMRARVAERVAQHRARNAAPPDALPAIPKVADLKTMAPADQRKLMMERDAARKAAEAKAAKLEAQAKASREKAEKELAAAKAALETAQAQAATATAAAANQTLPTAEPFDALAVIQEGFSNLSKADRGKFLGWLKSQLTAGERKLLAGDASN